MWIEQRGRQHRVYWRTKTLNGPTKDYEPFPTRDAAESFIQFAQKLESVTKARAFVRRPRGADLVAHGALGAAQAATSGCDRVGQVGGDDASGGAEPRDPRLTGVTFDHLWERYIARQRQLEEGTVDLYTGYYDNHFKPFFGGIDIGLIRRHKPLVVRAEDHGVLYVDDGWLAEMFAKQKLSNVGRPRPGTHLTIGFIENVLIVLGQVFDFAVEDREVPFEVNPARGIRLPKQDRREMHFLRDRAAYLALRCAMHEINPHFVPLLDFLIGTGARYGEAAGLLARHVHLDADRPHVEIRLALKWRGKKWKLGRPKTKSSIRRIDLPPRLVEVLRPLLEGKAPDDHVFTMVEGGPLHHGNFLNRYFKPAVKAAGAAVPKGLRIHDLRHSHAAFLLSSGISIYLVSRRLGHSSTATTTEVYGHLTPDAMDGVVQVVDGLLPDVLDIDVARRKAKVLAVNATEQTLPEFDIDDLDDLAA